MRTCVHACMHASIQSCIHPSFDPSIHPSIYPSVHLSIHLSILPSAHLSIRPYPPVYLSICLSTRPSIYEGWLSGIVHRLCVLHVPSPPFLGVLHVRTCAQVHARAHVHAHVHTHRHLCAYASLYTQARATHAWIHLCKRAAHTCMHMNAHVHACIQSHTHMHTKVQTYNANEGEICAPAGRAASRQALWQALQVLCMPMPLCMYNFCQAPYAFFNKSYGPSCFPGFRSTGSQTQLPEGVWRPKTREI